MLLRIPPCAAPGPGAGRLRAVSPNPFRIWQRPCTTDSSNSWRNTRTDLRKRPTIQWSERNYSTPAGRGPGGSPSTIRNRESPFVTSPASSRTSGGRRQPTSSRRSGGGRCPGSRSTAISNRRGCPRSGRSTPITSGTPANSPSLRKQQGPLPKKRAFDI